MNAPEKVKPYDRAAETVGEGKLRLKATVAGVYLVQIIAANIPYGAAVVYLLNLFERFWVLREWQALDRMERTARDLIRWRDTISRDAPTILAMSCREMRSRMVISPSRSGCANSSRARATRP